MSDNKFRYKNEKCPVCDRQFEETDDIVVCPVCGTPHHRACYEQNGRCGNAPLHGEGYGWQPAESAADTAPEEGRPTAVPSAALAHTDGGDGQPSSPLFGGGGGIPSPFSDLPVQLDEGVATEEAAAAVQLGAYRYMLKFFHRKGGKRTWNWAAFFFTPYWFFYRKLYKLGAVFMAVMLGVNIAASLIPASAAFTEASMDIYYSYLEGSVTAEAFTASFSQLLSSNRTGAAIIILNLAVILAVRIFAAAMADKWYYKAVTERVREIKSKNLPVAEQRMMIFRRGGASIGATVLAYMVEQAAIMGLNMLLTLL